MNLKKFNRGENNKRHTGAARARIMKYGEVRFNKGACEAIGFKKGDKVNFYQDQDKPLNWYVQKTEDPNGIALRKDETGAVCNSASTVRELLKSIEIFGNVTLQIATVPENGLYAIITKSAKPKSD